MLEARFDEKFDRFGTWHFGNGQGAGRLTYDPGIGLTLEFTGNDRAIEMHFGGRAGPFIISGRLAPPQAEVVTLEDCHLAKRVENYQDATATFRVGRALFGSPSAADVARSVTELWFDMTTLDEWAAPALPLLDVEPLQDARTGFSVATSDPLPSIEIAADGATVKLHSAIDRSYSNSSASFHRSTSFLVKLDRPATLDDALATYVRPLENFITLGTGSINAVRSLWIRSAEHRRPVVVLFRPVQARSQRSAWLVWPTGLFSLLDVEDRVGQLITSRLQVYARYRTVCDQLFFTIYSRQYLEGYFLSIVQTLEGFHRMNPAFRQKKLAPEEYSALKRIVLGAVANEDRKFIADVMQHGNDVSLRSRLQELMEFFGDLVSGILRPEERPTFPRRCARIRNAMAHHLPDDQNIDADEMFRFSDFMLRLIVAGLLTDVGFAPEAVRHALQRGASVVREQRFGA